MKTRQKHLSQFFDGAAVLAIATVVTKVLGLLYKAPLSRILGDEGMGYFNSAYTVYTFFYILCSAGVPKAVSILVSENDAKNERCGERKIIRKALLFFALFGVLLTLLFLTFSDSICKLINNSGAYYTMLVIAPSVLFVSVSGVAKGHLSGNSRLLPLAVSQLIEGGAKFFLGIAFALIGYWREMDIRVLCAFTILGITVGSIISALYLLICSRLIVPKEKSTLQKGSQKSIRRIIKISIPLTLGAAVMSISNMIDLATVMRGLRALGYSEAGASALYGNYTTLAVPMFNLIVSLITPFFIASLPLLSRSYTRGDIPDFENQVSFCLKKAFFISVPSSVAFIFYSKEILSLIFDSESSTIGAPLLSVLAPSLIFLTGQTTVNTALEASGHYKAPIITMLIGVIPKLVASYFLIGNNSIGILGAPIGTVLCYAVGFFCSLIILQIKSDVHVPVFKEIWRPLTATFGALFISEFVHNIINFPENRIIFSLSNIIIFGVLYLFLYSILVGCTKNESFFLTHCTKNGY